MSDTFGSTIYKLSLLNYFLLLSCHDSVRSVSTGLQSIQLKTRPRKKEPAWFSLLSIRAGLDLLLLLLLIKWRSSPDFCHPPHFPLHILPSSIPSSPITPSFSTSSHLRCGFLAVITRTPPPLPADRLPRCGFSRSCGLCYCLHMQFNY